MSTPVDAGSQSGPLAGLLVADFTRVLAGPYATMLLADMGATVIKVEGPSGDDSRLWMPPSRDGESTYYLAVNRNKHSIALDLKDADDLALAHAIVERADVFMENYKPGGAAGFGFDHETLAAKRPDLVHVSITGFGTAGGSDLPGYDLLVQGVSGLMSVTGHPDGPPQRAGVAMFDVITGLHAAIGALGALHERSVSGLGQHVELNLLSSALSGLVNQTSGYASCGNVPFRLGNDHPSLFPYGPFPTGDKDLIVCVGNDTQFAALAACLGRAELADDPRFTTMLARNTHRDELRPIMAEVMTEHGAEHWSERLRAAGVPCAPILGVDEGVRFAESIGLEPIAPAGRGERVIPTISHPVRYGRTPVHYPKAPPLLDEDRAAVLHWLEGQR